jgi:hypothetical protein
LSLAAARTKADTAIRALEAGRDPQGGDAFDQTLETFTTHCERNNKPGTAAEVRRRMEAIFKKSGETSTLAASPAPTCSRSSTN